MCNCQICGSELKPRKGKANKYCSMACYRAFQKSGNYTIEANRTIKPEPCCNCGEMTVRSKSKKRDGTKSDKVFCSRGCYDALRAREIKERETECKGCKKPFIPKNPGSVYCSMRCRNLDITVNCEVNCKSCGRPFSAISYRKSTTGNYIYVKNKTRKVCSQECKAELYRNDEERKKKISAAFKGSKHPMWRGGVSSERQYRGYGWAEARVECLSIHGNKCVKCGLSNDDSVSKYGSGLHIDHIIPWHSFEDSEEANKQSNLRPLCISCHGKHGEKVMHGMYKEKKPKDELKAALSRAKISLKTAVYILNNYQTNGVSFSNVSELHEKTGVSKLLIREIGMGRHKIARLLKF